MFIMREVWLLVFKYPSQAKVDNEYSKDDIMLKGRVIRKTHYTSPTMTMVQKHCFLWIKSS